MSFSEIELKRIAKIVGNMCELRSPPHLHDKLRTTFEVKGQDVVVCEERPRWDNPLEWLRTSIAKFKYVRKHDVWKLYWMRRDEKWYAYDTPGDPTGLDALVKEVDIDPHGAFWG